MYQNNHQYQIPYYSIFELIFFQEITLENQVLH